MPDTTGGTILVVEDNRDDADLARLAISMNATAVEVVVVEDGAEALEYLASVDRAPDLVLLDLNMTGLSGLDVLRQVRGDVRLRRLPVVILSSSDEAQDIETSYDLGANGYVRKPVDFGAFMAAVRTVEQYWLELNVAAPTRRLT